MLGLSLGQSSAYPITSRQLFFESLLCVKVLYWGPRQPVAPSWPTMNSLCPLGQIAQLLEASSSVPVSVQEVCRATVLQYLGPWFQNPMVPSHLPLSSVQLQVLEGPVIISPRWLWFSCCHVWRPLPRHLMAQGQLLSHLKWSSLPSMCAVWIVPSLCICATECPLLLWGPFMSQHCQRDSAFYSQQYWFFLHFPLHRC